MTPRGLEALQKNLKYHFKDQGLLDLALTHRSHGHESGRPLRHNETLEFLGDAVLGFVVAEALRKAAAPEVPVGALSRTRASLVSEASLAPRAEALGLGAALRLGRGEEATGGRGKPSLLSDVFEAVVAAIYLDGGMRAARAFIIRQFPEGLEPGPVEPVGEPKSRLQELLQARGEPVPRYVVVSQEGPDNDRTFVVEVVVGDRALARGTGRTKKGAGQEAARAALKLRDLRPRRRGSRGPRRPGGDRG